MNVELLLDNQREAWSSILSGDEVLGLGAEVLWFFVQEEVGWLLRRGICIELLAQLAARSDLGWKVELRLDREVLWLDREVVRRSLHEKPTIGVAGKRLFILRTNLGLESRIPGSRGRVLVEVLGNSLEDLEVGLGVAVSVLVDSSDSDLLKDVFIEALPEVAVLLRDALNEEDEDLNYLDEGDVYNWEG